MRKIFCAIVLTMGLAGADTPADKKKGPGGGKAKTGSACKVDDDCEQSSRPQRCRDSKCEPLPSHPVT